MRKYCWECGMPEDNEDKSVPTHLPLCERGQLISDLAAARNEIVELRKRAERAESAIDSYARLCGWDNHCEYWVGSNGFIKVQIRPSTFYVFWPVIGQAVIAIRARQAADAVEDKL